MKIFRKLYFIFKDLFLGNIKITLKNPKKSNLIIFDDLAFEDYEFLLKGKNFFLMQARYDRIKNLYLSFNILKKTIITYINYKNDKGRLLSAYLISLIETINPKLIVTHVDNSIKFSKISKYLQKKYEFLVIQNASRYDQIINELNFKKNLNTKIEDYKLYIKNFCCFGEYEVDLYKKLNYDVKNFHIFGSLRKSNFFTYLNKKNIKLKPNLFKLGILLEVPLSTPGLIPNVKNHIFSFVMPIIYSIKFSKKKNIRPVFIFKWKKIDDQLKLYKNYLTSEDMDFIKKNVWERKIKNFTSYEGVFQSEVVVGMASTLLREKISSKEKILSCNYSGSSFWDFPIKGVCFLRELGYEKFEKRLEEIYSLSISDYLNKLDKDCKYLCNQESNDASIKKINNLIDRYTC